MNKKFENFYLKKHLVCVLFVRSIGLYYRAGHLKHKFSAQDISRTIF